MREQFGFGVPSSEQNHSGEYDVADSHLNEQEHSFDHETVSSKKILKERLLTGLHSFELTGNRMDDGFRFLDLTNHSSDADRIRSLRGGWQKVNLYSQLKFADMVRKLHYENNSPDATVTSSTQDDEFRNLELVILKDLLPQWQLHPDEAQDIATEFESETHQKIQSYEQEGLNLKGALDVTYHNLVRRVDADSSELAGDKEHIDAKYQDIVKSLSLFQAMCRFHHRPFEGITNRNLDIDGLADSLTHFELIEGDIKRALEKIQEAIQEALHKWDELLTDMLPTASDPR